MKKKIIKAFNDSSIHLYRAFLVLSYIGFLKGIDIVLRNHFTDFVINILKYIVMYFVVKFVVKFASGISDSE